VIWVTWNLWRFLKQLRLTYGGDIVLWADAICINQQQNECGEKSQQMRYMTRIYPQAGQVLCWLGEEDGTVAEAFETLREWDEALGPFSALLDEKGRISKRVTHATAQLRHALALRVRQNLKRAAQRGTIGPLARFYSQTLVSTLAKV
jgi:hypothetical protein